MDDDRYLGPGRHDVRLICRRGTRDAEALTEALSRVTAEQYKERPNAVVELNEAVPGLESVDPHLIEPRVVDRGQGSDPQLVPLIVDFGVNILGGLGVEALVGMLRSWLLPSLRREAKAEDAIGAVVSCSITTDGRTIQVDVSDFNTPNQRTPSTVFVNVRLEK